MKRQGDTKKRLRTDQNHLRSGFEVDYDRIIFSSAFRHLQDKTQVIPFSQSGFVHTRLTHSLEVSVVGRSLGRAVGHAVIQKHPALGVTHGYQPHDFGTIVAAACLAHDIGNPPFGHSGEQAIGDFFTSGAGAELISTLTEAQQQDLIRFEGNANGFRILTEDRGGVPGGLRLSYVTLGTFTKYPKASIPIQPTQKVSDKKFGFFQAQSTFFSEVASDLGLQDATNTFHRHPLAFLVEAADDICYTLIDFEDGINLGWIPESYALEYLINLVKDSLDQKKFSILKHTPQRMAYLRALAINSLIKDSVSIFLENEKEILEGNFKYALLDKSKYKAQIEDIISLSIKNVYRSQEVLQKEIIGYKVISNLLNAFVNAAHNKFLNKESSFDKLLLRLIPDGTPLVKETIYLTILNATCFVASLSDCKAKKKKKKIK